MKLDSTLIAYSSADANEMLKKSRPHYKAFTIDGHELSHDTKGQVSNRFLASSRGSNGLVRGVSAEEDKRAATEGFQAAEKRFKDAATNLSQCSSAEKVRCAHLRSRSPVRGPSLADHARAPLPSARLRSTSTRPRRRCSCRSSTRPRS